MIDNQDNSILSKKNKSKKVDNLTRVQNITAIVKELWSFDKFVHYQTFKIHIDDGVKQSLQYNIINKALGLNLTALIKIEKEKYLVTIWIWNYIKLQYNFKRV